MVHKSDQFHLDGAERLYCVVDICGNIYQQVEVLQVILYTILEMVQWCTMSACNGTKEDNSSFQFA